MRILGIDSSTPKGSVALLENEKIISESVHLDSSKFSNRVLTLVDTVLSQAGVELKDIDGIGVTTGPGSFTGLRVGVSLVKGFVLSTGKPFRCINTLEAIAARVEPTPHPIYAVLDARKKEVYAAQFAYEDKRLKRTSPDCAVSPEALCERITEPTVFVGSGLETYGDFFSTRLDSRFINRPKIKSFSLAASAALLAHHQFESHKSFDLNELRITYVRKSEAEINLAGTH